MLHSALLARQIATPNISPPRRILDLGSGDGRFMLSVLSRASIPDPGTLTLLDQSPAQSASTLKAFETLGWTTRPITCDVFAFLRDEHLEPFDLVTANLFLHHFREGELSQLLGLLSTRSDWVIACEPARTPLALVGSHLLWAIGCSEVTRHDAVASVRAGFTRHEISSLWPKSPEWILSERPAPPFSHLFSARKKHG
jgi:hypothetical protein